MVSLTQMVWEPKKYLKIFFDLCHVSKVAAHFQKKNKMFVYSFKYPNNGKILKNEAAEPYLEPCYLNL